MGVVKSFIDLVAPNQLPDILVLDPDGRLMKNYKTVSTVNYDHFFPKTTIRYATPQKIYEYLEERDFKHHGKTFIVNDHKEVIAAIFNEPQYGNKHPMPLTSNRLTIRDMNRCQYTGRQLTQKTRSRDHIIPESEGGETTWENLVLCENKLNSVKSSLTLEEFESSAKKLGYEFILNAQDITQRAFEPSIEYLFQNYCLMFPRKCRPEWIDMINWDGFEPIADLKRHIQLAHTITPRPPNL